jgi:hypothetical protein
LKRRSMKVTYDAGLLQSRLDGTSPRRERPGRPTTKPLRGRFSASQRLWPFGSRAVYALAGLCNSPAYDASVDMLRILVKDAPINLFQLASIRSTTCSPASRPPVR